MIEDRPETGAAGEPVLVDDLPAGEAPTIPSGAPVDGIAPQGFDPESSVELTERRDAFITVYANTDGSETVVASGSPVHFQNDKGEWLAIDNTLITSDTGVVRNTANSWQITFGPLASVGVTITDRRGSLSWVGDQASDVKPVVEPDGVSVRYVDAWPGVDVVYLVSGSSVEEQVVLKSATATPEVRFVLPKVDIERTDAGAVTLVSGELKLPVGPVFTFDATGEKIDGEAKVEAGFEADAELDRSVLTVGVDAEWLKAQPSDRFPIVIDPSVSPSISLLKNWPTPNSVYTSGWEDGTAWFGYPDDMYAPEMIWRAVAKWDYWSGGSSLLGKRVTNATVTATVLSNSTPTTRPWQVYWADENGSHSSVSPRTLPAPYPYGNSWTPFATGTLGSTGTTGTLDVTSLYDYWTRNSISDGMLLFTGDETDTGIQRSKHVSLALSITYNAAPSTPVLTGSSNPADGSRWLSAPAYLVTSQSTDGESDPLSYRIELSDSSNFSTGVIFSSPWTTYSTSAPVGGISLSAFDLDFLDPLDTYYWRIAVTDGWYVVPSTTSRSFIWDPDPAIAPSDSQGPFSVNLASGELTTGVSTPSFEAIGGSIGAGVSYSSHDLAPAGLVRKVTKDSNTNGVPDSGEPVVERHLDAAVDVDWGTGGPTADTTDNFIAEWTGTITAPASGWQLGIECDQKAKITLGGSTVLDTTSSSCASIANSGAIDWATGTLSTSPTSISVRLVETTGSARARLWVRQGTGQPVKIESSWLNPGGAKILPAGWSFTAGSASLAYEHATVDGDSLVLTSPGGATTTWTRASGSSSSQGWVPQASESGTATPGTDGTIAVQAADGMTYTFNADGTLRSAITSTDDKSRSASAVYSYDGSGRLTKVVDPVSGRELRVIYEGQSGCSASPIPAGFLCAVQYSNSSSATPETWTTFAYSSTNTATATLSSVTSFPNSSSPSDLNYNDTTQFGYSGSLLNMVRTPLAYDALRSGVRSDTTSTTYDVTWGGDGNGWQWPTTITMPAPTSGASRPAVSYTMTANTDRRGFSRADMSVAGMSPPAGYLASYLIDTKGRAYETYDSAARMSSITWDSQDRVTTTVGTTGNKNVTVYNADGLPQDVWGPAPSGDDCWAVLPAAGGAQPSQCLDVPLVRSDYDLNSSGNEFEGLQATWWGNTTGAATTATESPLLNALGIASGTGAVDTSWGSAAPAGVTNSSGTPVTDNVSAQLDGIIVFPASGSYSMKLVADDQASLWIDDTQIITNAGTGGATGTYVNSTAGSRHRIRISYLETTGNASLSLQWQVPGGGSYVAVPSGQLHPGFGYATRTRTFDGSGNVADEQTMTVNAIYGQPLTTSTGASSPATETYTYETHGTSGTWDRILTRTLPAGNTWDYVYWGDTATLGSTICGLASTTLQAGMLRRRLGPDPDGAGSQKRRIEEFIYDDYGHQRGSRVGTEGSTAGQLDSSVAWSCVTTIDTRWRTTRQDYPASVTDPTNYPARTAYLDTAKGGNPFVTEICDDNVAGSADATSGACNGLNGVITTTIDLLGRVISYTDVWSKTTTTTYDQAGRVTARSGPMGSESFGYQSDGAPTTYTLDGTTLATSTYNSAGQLKSVSYANGTALADLDVTGRRFPDGSTKELTFTGPSSTTITSNAITNRDRNGRVLAEVIDGETSTYHYDTLGRLDHATAGTSAGSAPAHRDSTSANNSSGGTSITINRPAGTVNGDLLLASIGVGATSTGGSTTGYQAESATLTGVSTYSWCTTIANYCSGTGAVGSFDPNSTDSIEWTVTAPAAGTYDISFRRASGFGAATRKLFVNGTQIDGAYVFPATANMQTWDSTTALAVTLNAGSNTIKLQSRSNSNDQWMDVDRLDVTDPPSAGTPATVTAPSGWTLVANSAGTASRAVVYQRTAASGDPSSWNFTLSTSVKAAGGITAYSGIGTAPIDVTGIGTNTSGTSHTIGSVTTTGTNRTLVTVVASALNTTATPPSGSTERIDQAATSGGFSVAVETADAAISAAGVTGSRTATTATAATSATAAVALQPASTGGTTWQYQFAATGGCGTLTTAGANSNRTALIVNGSTQATYCYDNADRLTSTTQSGYIGTISYDNRGNTTLLAGDTSTYDGADRHMKVVDTSTVTYLRDALQPSRRTNRCRHATYDLHRQLRRTHHLLRLQQCPPRPDHQSPRRGSDHQALHR